MEADEGEVAYNRRSGSPRDGEAGSTAIIVLLLLGAAILAGLAVWLVMTGPDSAPPVATTPVPASEATPDASPTAPDQTGEVTVSSSVAGSEVSIDGQRRGPAPQTAALAAGSHTVRVESHGFQVFERQVQVIPGRSLELEARLERPPPTLVVRADVAGAQVFLDRKFLGEAPVTARDVERGRHRLNVSADGYEMYTGQVDVTDGTNEIVVSFKEVRLSESLAVKHKHGLGSCQGRLVATADGLRYETDHDKDRFEALFSALDPLEVDYLDKNLQVQVRGGRKYNFTTDDADALLTFQKAVESARERLQ